MRKITAYFLRGLLVFVPAALTVAAIVFAFTRLDSILRGLLHIDIPGLGLALTIAAIILIGILASNFAGRWFFNLIDRLFTRLPLIKLLYNSLKDFISAFAGEKKSFDKPALVQLTPGGPLAVGFITRESLEILGLADHVAVYFPPAPYSSSPPTASDPSTSTAPTQWPSSSPEASPAPRNSSGKPHRPGPIRNQEPFPQCR
jgi:uncharacterized membrane protein